MTVFAERRRIPLVLERRSGLYSDGVLFEIGPDVQEMHVQAAAYVDRILRGARPADLQMEPPTRLDVVVNLKTAQSLGLTMPQSVLDQATQVIQ